MSLESDLHWSEVPLEGGDYGCNLWVDAHNPELVTKISIWLGGHRAHGTGQ